MKAIMGVRPTSAHPVIPDIPARMAKANLRKPESEAWREHIGRAVERARLLRGWSLKEFSAAVSRDERQCARWMSGAERPQFDALFAVETLRHPLVQAFGEIAGADVEVTVRLKRPA